MRFHFTNGKQFAGLAKYLQTGRRDNPTDKGATILFAQGVRTSSPEATAADFEFGRRANAELSRPVWAGSLSFNPDDLAAGRLPPARMLEVGLAFSQKMGLGDTQLLIVLHADTDKAHLHLLANQVADDGHTVSTRHVRWRGKQAAAELVEEFGLTPARGNRPQLQHPDRVVRQPDRAMAFVRQALGYELPAATSREELRAGLTKHGVTMHEWPRGVSFTHKGISVSGSRIGRQFSAGAIDQQLAANLAQRTAQEAEQMMEQAHQSQLVVNEQPAAGAATAHREELLQPGPVERSLALERALEAWEREKAQQAADRIREAADQAQQAAWDAGFEAYSERAEQLQRLVDEAARAREELGAPLSYLLQLRGIELAAEGIRYQGETELFPPDMVTVPADAHTKSHPLVQYGMLSVGDHDGKSAPERAEDYRKFLVKYHMHTGTVQVDAATGVAQLSYCLQIERADLTQVMEKLSILQLGASRTRLREAPHPLRDPEAVAHGLAVPQQWPPRKGEFGEATVSMASTTPANQVKNIEQMLRQAGGALYDLGQDAHGTRQLRVLYHTHQPEIGRLNAILDGAALLAGVHVRETAGQREKRHDGAQEKELERTQAVDDQLTRE